MSKDAVIRFRSSSALARRIERLADRQESNLSDYLRARIIEMVEREEAKLGLLPHDVGITASKSSAPKKAQTKGKGRRRPTPPVPDIGQTG